MLKKILIIFLIISALGGAYVLNNILGGLVL
jgi:hypothetical protein